MYIYMSSEWRTGLEDNVLEGTSSKQKRLSVLLNWNCGGNCLSETPAISFLMAFVGFPTLQALTVLLNLRGVPYLNNSP